MTENEEVERYRKILEDWRPGPPQKGAQTLSVRMPTPEPQAPVTQAAVATPSRGAATAGVTYSPGAILLFNQRTLAIYKRQVPDKEYHLVLVLCPNNAVKTQGIMLEAYDVEELGNLPPAWFERLQNEMRWERDLIVFHCYRYEDIGKIPTAEGLEEPRGESEPPAPAQETPEPPGEPARPEKANGFLRRGQRIQIKFGSNLWDAVYWGRDDQGQVIAHKTYESWSLMHLDLERFSSNLMVDHEVDQSLIQEIEQSLLNS